MELEKIIFLIASIYFWLLFGGLTNTLTCDLKKSFDNPIFRQFTAIISIFLLFMIIEKNDSGAYDIWKNTFILYIFYLLFTKSKWYFSIPIIILILIDQTILTESKYLNKKNISKEDNKNSKIIESLNNYRKYIHYFIIFLIIIGAIHYFFRQKNKFNKNFDIFKFMFDVTCKSDKINFNRFT